jgi:hypothetical protein
MPGVAYTGKLSVVAHAYLDIVNAVKVANNIQDVYYGNQVMFPRTPCVVVEPDTKNATIRNAPRGTLNTFRVLVLIVHSKVQDSQVTRDEADALAEALETEFHRAVYKTLPDGIGQDRVVHQFVVRVESGFVNRQNSDFMTTKITLEAENVTQLPY